MLSGIEGIEPLSIFFIVLVQFGGRYLKIDLTPAQQKIINNSIFQTILLFSLVFMATKNVFKSFIIVAFLYICVKIIFNENHKYNLLSKKWLVQENIVKDTSDKSLKEIYKKILKVLINIIHHNNILLYFIIILSYVLILLILISIISLIFLSFLDNS